MFQAMNAKEAKEMLSLSRQHPELVTMIVPSPITFEYDATISNIIKAGSLGDLVYIEVSLASNRCIKCPPANVQPDVLRPDT